MSSSPPEEPTDARSKSPVSIGTSLSCEGELEENPFPLPASSRPPRNCTDSATISTDCRLLPSLSVHSRHCRRPSTAIGRPLERYRSQFSPCAPHTETSK